MPFYEYECGACGHRLEALQKISDEPLIYCPECNDPSLKKQISAAAFRLKGTGWYETDFKGGKKEDDKSSDKASDKKPSTDKPASGSSNDSATKSTSSSSSDTAPKAGSASSAST